MGMGGCDGGLVGGERPMLSPWQRAAGIQQHRRRAWPCWRCQRHSRHCCWHLLLREQTPAAATPEGWAALHSLSELLQGPVPAPVWSSAQSVPAQA